MTRWFFKMMTNKNANKNSLSLLITTLVVTMMIILFIMSSMNHNGMVHAYELACAKKSGIIELGKCYYHAEKAVKRDPLEGHNFCQNLGYQGLLQINNHIEAQYMIETYDVWTGIRKRRDNAWIQMNNLQVASWLEFSPPDTTDGPAYALYNTTGNLITVPSASVSPMRVTCESMVEEECHRLGAQTVLGKCVTVVTELVAYPNCPDRCHNINSLFRPIQILTENERDLFSAKLEFETVWLDQSISDSLYKFRNGILSTYNNGLFPYLAPQDHREILMFPNGTYEYAIGEATNSFCACERVISEECQKQYGYYFSGRCFRYVTDPLNSFGALAYCVALGFDAVAVANNFDDISFLYDISLNKTASQYLVRVNNGTTALNAGQVDGGNLIAVSSTDLLPFICQMKFVCFGRNSTDTGVCGGRGRCVGNNQCLCNDPNVVGDECTAKERHPFEAQRLNSDVNLQEYDIRSAVVRSNVVYFAANHSIYEVLKNLDQVTVSPLLNNGSSFTGNFRSDNIATSKPYGLAVGPDQILYTSDQDLAIVRGINFDTEMIDNVVSHDLTTANGIAVSSQSIYVSDGTFVKQFDLLSGNLTSTDLEVPGDTPLVFCHGKLFFSSEGDITVYEEQSHSTRSLATSVNDGQHFTVDPVSGALFLYSSSSILSFSTNGVQRSLVASGLDSALSYTNKITINDIKAMTLDQSYLTVLGSNGYTEVKFRCEPGFQEPECVVPLCFGTPATDQTVCNSRGTCIAPDVCVCNNNDFDARDCSGEAGILTGATVSLLKDNTVGAIGGALDIVENSFLYYCDASTDIMFLNRITGAVEVLASPGYPCNSITPTKNQTIYLVSFNSWIGELDIVAKNVTVIAGIQGVPGNVDGYSDTSMVGVVESVVIDPYDNNIAYFADGTAGTIKKLDLRTTRVTTITTGSSLMIGHVSEVSYYGKSLGRLTLIKNTLVFSANAKMFELSLKDMNIKLLTTLYLAHITENVLTGDLYISGGAKNYIDTLSADKQSTTIFLGNPNSGDGGNDVASARFNDIRSTLFDQKTRELIIFSKGNNQIRTLKFACDKYAGDQCDTIYCAGIPQGHPDVCGGKGFCESQDKCTCNRNYGSCVHICLNDTSALCPETGTCVHVSQCVTPEITVSTPTYSPPCSDAVVNASINIPDYTLTWRLVDITLVNSKDRTALELALQNESGPVLTLPNYMLIYGTVATLNLTISSIAGTVSRLIELHKNALPGATIIAPAVVKGYEQFTLNSSIAHFPSCIDTSSLTYAWKIDDIVVSTEYAFVVGAKTQLPGYHTVKLITQVSQISSESDFQFYVQRPTPIPRIAGGSAKITQNSSYILDASLSSDDEISSLKIANFTWSAESLDPYVDYTYMINVTESNGQKAVFVPTIVGNFQISLTMSSVDGRTGVTTVKITVVSQVIPSVRLISKNSVLGTSLKLAFEAEVLANVSMSSLEFEWILYNLGLDSVTPPAVNLTSQDLLVPSNRLKNFVIRPNTLSPGSSYMLKVFCNIRGSQEKAFSTLSFYMRPPPTTTDPVGITALVNNSTVHVEAVGWTDNPNSLNLQYAFEYYDSQTQSWNVLAPFGDSSAVDAQFFVPKAQDITIVCRVRNIFYAQRKVNITVHLDPKPVLKTDVQSLLSQKKSQLLSGSVSSDLGFVLLQVTNYYARSSETIDPTIAFDLIDIITRTIDSTSQKPEQFANQQMKSLEYLAESVSGYNYQLLNLTKYVLWNFGVADVDEMISSASSTISRLIQSNNGTNDISSMAVSTLKKLTTVVLNSKEPDEEATTLSTTSYTLVAFKTYGSSLQNVSLGSNYSSIRLPENVISNSNSDSVFSMEYYTYPDQHSALWNSDIAANISSSIISVRILDESLTKVAIEASESDPLVLVIKKNNESSTDDELATFTCRYYDETIDLEWGTYGCWLYNETDEYVICHCNHTTSFAAFVQYSKKDLEKPLTKDTKNLYYARIAFNAFFMIIIAILVVFLIIVRNRQPVRSRLFAPLFCLFALFIECSLQGVLRSALLSVDNRAKMVTAINVIGGIIITISCPLSVTALFIYLWQNVRYMLMRQYYEIMDLLDGKIHSSRLAQVSKLIISKALFIVSCVLVFVPCFIYFLVISTVGGVESSKSSTTATALTISNAVVYLGLLALMSIGIVITFLWDASIGKLLQQKKLRANSEARTPKETPKDAQDKLKKVVEPISKHFLKDDPLFFRLDALLISFTVCFGFVYFALGIAVQYGGSHLQSTPIQIALLVFEIVFVFLRIFAFGGALAIIVLAKWRRTNFDQAHSEIVDEGTMEHVLLGLIKSKHGNSIFRDYCVKEFALENLLAFQDLDKLKADWSSLDEVHKQARFDTFYSLYVQSGSDLEVNIPGVVRKLVNQLKQDIQSEASKDVWRKLLLALLQNITDTFSRFVDTIEYQQYIQHSEMNKRLEDVSLSVAL